MIFILIRVYFLKHTRTYYHYELKIFYKIKFLLLHFLAISKTFNRVNILITLFRWQ